MEEHQQEAGKESKPSSTSVDLQGDSPLQVEISDAVSERDKVKFTVQTKSGLPHFAQPEFSVVRQHEEFIWLHDTYVENEEYAGLIVRRGQGWAGTGTPRQKAVTAPWQCILPLSRFPQPLPGQTLRLHGKSCRSWVRGTAPSPGKNSPG